MEQLLTDVTAAVRRAGDALLAEYGENARPTDKNDMALAGRRLDATVTAILEPALSAIRPEARWVDSDQEMSVLAPGEWWAGDPIEGGVNYVHGMDQWSVTVALIRDNLPVLAVVYEPVRGRTWTAVRGGGAFVDRQPLTVSTKKDVDAAFVTTTQPRTKNRQFGDAMAALLDRALLVRSTVPSTFPQLDVAAGHVDVYWQYECDLIGVAAGVLLVTEAGGVVTNLRGEPWQPGDTDILAAAPGLHGEFLSILRTV
ncbi:inositol monophosphatase [Kutzneria sp. NPDC051319]|uniref:inositol monophosphatase family protein n=1 Tax=Kutzneria sp. NPDC051319 TaxID=3155047 RepID=UPI0034137860